MKKEIFVTKAYLPPRAEFDEYLDKIWDSAWLTNMGKLHEELRKELADYLGVSGIELFVNGHLALEMCLQAFNFPKGSEVITTPFSFASTTHAIVRQGLTPVFADVKPTDCTLDPERIEELITDKTVAILPVHVYGNVCDVEAIRKIAAKRGLKVIYDAAHAFGETVNGRGIGTYGDASMFSFHATKVYNTIEGGAVTWNAACDESCDDYFIPGLIRNDSESKTVEGQGDAEAFCETDGSGVRFNIAEKSDFARKLYQLKNFGIVGQEQVGFVGGNAKMNEFQAAMGLCNLKHIEELIEARHKIYDRYMIAINASGGKVRCLLADADGNAAVSLDEGVSKTADADISLDFDEDLDDDTRVTVKRNFAYFPVLFETEGHRDEVFEKLAAKGIHARKYFYPCINDYDCYKDKYDSDDTPVAKDIASRVLTLPIYHDLETETVDEICRIIIE